MSVNNKLKIGIVGCGTIADIQAQAIQNAINTELNSVYSRSEKNARRVGEKYNTKWSTDWDHFLADKNMDAVAICTPNGNHLDYGKKAAEAGKHVIVEKPIEVSLSRGRQLIESCRQHGVKLAVIYQNRFMTEAKRMKQMIDDNEIGRIFMGDGYIKWYRTQEYYDSGAWRGTLALDGGGVLINQAIHTIDLLQWYMGAVDSIFGNIATLSHQRLEGEDNAIAILQFKNGAMGVIEASTSIQPAQARRIEIHGSKGSLILNGDELQVLIEGQKDNEPKKDELPTKESMGASSPLGGFSIEPHKNQFVAIADAIFSNKIPPVSGPESLKSLAIVLAIYESAKIQIPVDFEQFLRDSAN